MKFISVRNLSFSYQKKKPVLADVSFDLLLGDFVALVGLNGAGKTTLAKLLIGVLCPTEGDILVAGNSIRGKSAATIAEKIGFVYQNPNTMLFAKTVEEELKLSLVRSSFSKEEKTTRVNELLAFFDLEEYRHVHPRLLSRGQKQKIAIATALIQNPDALILDEPFSGIDLKQKRIISTYLKKLQKEQQKLVVVITHNLEMIAEHCSKVIALRDGQLVFDLSTNDFLADKNHLTELGLVASPMLEMFYSLHAAGLPSEIVSRKALVSYFTEKKKR